MPGPRSARYGGAVLIVALPVLAHGTIYATTGLVAAPDDPEELWALAGGWGLLHSTDGAASWEWRCEEGLGVATLYAVDSLGPGEVVLGTSAGLVRWDGAPTVASGLPADAQVGGVRRLGGAVLADVVSVEEADGLYRCVADACSPTALVSDGLYVQSIAVGEAGAWVVVRESEQLHSTLWRSADGEDWTLVADWGEGADSRSILAVEGEQLWLWAQPRDPDGLPWMERSDDGGATQIRVWTSEDATSDVPVLSLIEGQVLFSNALGRTWRSPDHGATWIDVSETMPLLRCAAQVGEERWICADHFADGFDVARLDGPEAWTALGCMDEAAVADPACEAYAEAYVEAGLYGGGECDASWAPGEEAPGDCGCGGGGAAGLLLGLGLFQLRRRSS